MLSHSAACSLAPTLLIDDFCPPETLFHFMCYTFKLRGFMSTLVLQIHVSSHSIAVRLQDIFRYFHFLNTFCLFRKPISHLIRFQSEIIAGTIKKTLLFNSVHIFMISACTTTSDVCVLIRTSCRLQDLHSR